MQVCIALSCKVIYHVRLGLCMVRIRKQFSADCVRRNIHTDTNIISIPWLKRSSSVFFNSITVWTGVCFFTPIFYLSKTFTHLFLIQYSCMCICMRFSFMQFFSNILDFAKFSKTHWNYEQYFLNYELSNECCQNEEEFFLFHLKQMNGKENCMSLLSTLGLCGIQRR